uniref:SET domain-containing protein n=1 Tax=Macrostomum lignano TaxID=282301 RepID=A0A1I8FDT9_9PLAT
LDQWSSPRSRPWMITPGILALAFAAKWPFVAPWFRPQQPRQQLQGARALNYWSFHRPARLVALGLQSLQHPWWTPPLWPPQLLLGLPFGALFRRVCAQAEPAELHRICQIWPEGDRLRPDYSPAFQPIGTVNTLGIREYVEQYHGLQASLLLSPVLLLLLSKFELATAMPASERHSIDARYLPSKNRRVFGFKSQPCQRKLDELDSADDVAIFCRHSCSTEQERLRPMRRQLSATRQVGRCSYGATLMGEYKASETTFTDYRERGEEKEEERRANRKCQSDTRGSGKRTRLELPSTAGAAAPRALEKASAASSWLATMRNIHPRSLKSINAKAGRPTAHPAGLRRAPLRARLLASWRHRGARRAERPRASTYTSAIRELQNPVRAGSPPAAYLRYERSSVPMSDRRRRQRENYPQCSAAAAQQPHSTQRDQIVRRRDSRLERGVRVLARPLKPSDIAVAAAEAPAPAAQLNSQLSSLTPLTMPPQTEQPQSDPSRRLADENARLRRDLHALAKALPHTRAEDAKEKAKQLAAL